MKNKKEQLRFIDYSGAVFFLLLGVTFLLNNFGIVPWNVWSIIIQFWPALLIIVGINMIFAVDYFGHLLSSVLIIIIYLYVFCYSVSVVTPQFDTWLRLNLPEVKKSFSIIPNNIKGRQKCLPFDDTCFYRYSR